MDRIYRITQFRDRFTRIIVLFVPTVLNNCPPAQILQTLCVLFTYKSRCRGTKMCCYLGAFVIHLVNARGILYILAF